MSDENSFHVGEKKGQARNLGWRKLKKIKTLWELSVPVRAPPSNRFSSSSLKDRSEKVQSFQHLDVLRLNAEKWPRENQDDFEVLSLAAE